MSAAFTFADEEDQTFPEHCKSATVVWGEIAKTIMSDQIGRGECRLDGSIKIVYPAFEINLMPDGSFTGKRLTAKDMAPSTLKAVPNEAQSSAKTA